MAQDLPLVIRLPQTQGSGFVLLHISRDGPKPLDLRLIGTDGEEVYAVSLEHSKASSLQVKHSKISLSEWEAILGHLLLNVSSEDGVDSLTEGLEGVADVSPGKSIKVTFQKRIEGITQKLGEVVLPSNEEEEISLFDWCGLEIQSKQALRREVERLNKAAKEKDSQSRILEETLTELIKSKNASEDALLEKFSILLNEKKLKIRDQQRLLASSNVDPAKIEEVQSSRLEIAAPSRRGKRKAAAPIEPESSDEGFEKMEVDQEQDDDSDKQTERTASETESEPDIAPASPPRRTRGTSARPQAMDHTPEPRKIDPLAKPPPRRELPFSKKPPPKSVTKAASAATGGSDTESDDEL